VALLVTCLVDLFRPQVAEAAVRLLEQAGFTVDVPAQTCCGQVNANGGDREGAADMARQVIGNFAPYDYVVVPSGSCAGQVRNGYPALFPEGSADRKAADALASRVYELTGFLHDVAGLRAVPAKWQATATYHDSCSCRRELGIVEQPRNLLRSVAGLELVEMPQPEECCGFGGLFCVKYPGISARIADQKLQAIGSTQAQLLIGADLGCLLHLEGRLHREGSRVRVVHVAEVLAGMATEEVRTDAEPGVADSPR
jgi:L-lactate dehydrogenase complex protein LldE